MATEEIAVKESPKIDQEIRDICINYMELMLSCAKDREKRDQLMADPRPFLKEVGMVIPEKIHIHMQVGQSFPALHIKTPEGKIAVYEGKLSLELVEDLKDHDKIVHKSHKVTVKEQAEIDMTVNVALDDPNVSAVVAMPFFDLYTDILGEVKFQDGAEIILTSC